MIMNELTLCNCKGSGNAFDKRCYPSEKEAGEVAKHQSEKAHVKLEPYQCDKEFWHIRKVRKCEFCGWSGFSYTSLRVAQKEAKKKQQRTRTVQKACACPEEPNLWHIKRVSCRFAPGNSNGESSISYSSEPAAEKAARELEFKTGAEEGAFGAVECSHCKGWHAVETSKV